MEDLVTRLKRLAAGVGVLAAFVLILLISAWNMVFHYVRPGELLVVISKTGRQEQAHHYELAIDTKKNMPEIIRERVTFWEKEHGTAVTIELEGSYKKGRRSVDTYIEQTALANPHARLEYQPPKGELEIFERASEDLPVRPKEIQPHPHGVELGVLARVLKESTQARLTTALQENFSRVSARVGDEICKVAGLSLSTRQGPHRSRLPSRSSPSSQ